MICAHILRHCYSTNHESNMEESDIKMIVFHERFHCNVIGMFPAYIYSLLSKYSSVFFWDNSGTLVRASSQSLRVRGSGSCRYPSSTQSLLAFSDLIRSNTSWVDFTGFNFSLWANLASSRRSSLDPDPTGTSRHLKYSFSIGTFHESKSGCSRSAQFDAIMCVCSHAVCQKYTHGVVGAWWPGLFAPFQYHNHPRSWHILSAAR